jgi:hypothetical protein
MEATMTENTTHTTQLTPAEAATALAGLLPRYDEALARKKAAEQTINKTAVEAASTELAQIRAEIRRLMQAIAPRKQLSDSRCRVLVVAAGRGALPSDLREIAKAEKASMFDWIVVPARRYESLIRVRGREIRSWYEMPWMGSSAYALLPLDQFTAEEQAALRQAAGVPADRTHLKFYGDPPARSCGREMLDFLSNWLIAANLEKNSDTSGAK